ncbi:MAG: carboxypeptidase-like regulatory domain-containing protein [Acidobacteria bacterium]|nr:carboxypeptidase-like regulatory domain-containing protein [Acidobacteriota bacterium]
MFKNTSPAFLATILLCALALFAPLAAFTFRQNEGGKIVGRVIERDSDQLLAAEIGLAIRGRRGVTMKHTRASDQGQFEIAGLPAGEMYLTTKLEGYAVEHQSIFLNVGETREIEFRLIKAGTVRGTVLDSAGNPIENAQLSVIYADESTARGAIAATYQWEMGEVRSDATGAFAIQVHPEKEFIVEASHPAFVGEVSSPMRFSPMASRAAIKISLDRGVSFEGEVRDENGAPIQGAQVQLLETEERPELQRFASIEALKRRARTTVSGADGKFRFDQVNPAAKSLLITHPKYQPVKRTMEPGSDRELAPALMRPKSRNER